MKSGLTTKDVCSVEDCNNVVMTRGRCKKHYQRPIKTIPCSVSHCKNASHTRGFCRNHYLKALRHGEIKPRETFDKICMVDGCDKKTKAKGQCLNHYNHFRENERRRANPEKYRKIANAKRKKRAEDSIMMLGGKCDACGEKYNPNVNRSNLDIHHKFYDEHSYRKGGKSAWLEVLQKAEKGINVHKQFTLLCQQCNIIEAWVRKEPSKAFETFCYLSSEGYFDEALSKDDAKEFKKLSEFMK